MATAHLLRYERASPPADRQYRAGGFPSLIFPDGTLFSIPIPSSDKHDRYRERTFQYEGQPIQEILNDITKQQIRNSGTICHCDYSTGDQGCHHDPMRFRNTGILAMGQAGNAESERRNQDVNAGDVFVFYGWFRQSSQTESR